ncbi:Legumain [Liparis tanakae]|uniref:Legumain n=1 Tax=Liparis tanakae TaxID=230148 RepID=A0A4Z2EDH1_9TELE|nr:Legumain [Liparis tanakae]
MERGGRSGPNDHVFVFFADHGAPGILAFPDDDLSVDDFQNTIKYMHDNKKYKKTFTCLYATTAANAKESSYACYYDDKRDTYLGDWYSVNWMEDSDVEDLKKETLVKQFKIVKSHTNTSHVQQFGNRVRQPSNEKGERFVRYDRGSYGGKVMELKNCHFQAWKSHGKNFNHKRFGKVIEMCYDHM